MKVALLENARNTVRYKIELPDTMDTRNTRNMPPVVRYNDKIYVYGGLFHKPWPDHVHAFYLEVEIYDLG